MVIIPHTHTTTKKKGERSEDGRDQKGRVDRIDKGSVKEKKGRERRAGKRREEE